MIASRTCIHGACVITVDANDRVHSPGAVVITDELIALAKNDDEIMSVLFHEIGHVEHRHSLRMVISHSGLAILSLAMEVVETVKTGGVKIRLLIACIS